MQLRRCGSAGDEIAPGAIPAASRLAELGLQIAARPAKAASTMRVEHRAPDASATTREHVVDIDLRLAAA